MRVIFLAKDKPATRQALGLLATLGFEIVCVVAPPGDDDSLAGDASRLNVPSLRPEELDARLADPAERAALERGGIDLVISFLYWRRVREPLLGLGRLGTVNFHPAPLPELRGLGGYNFAILEEWDYFGVSAHFMDEGIDTGDLIEVERFVINASTETAWSLEQKTMPRLLAQFERVMTGLATGEDLPRKPQGEGRYIDRVTFEQAKWVLPEDDGATVERKARAFWYPPYMGATIAIGGRPFTLVTAEILSDVQLGGENVAR